MKILHIIDKLEVGGAERVLINQCNVLIENGKHVSVLCLLNESELDRELNQNIPIHYLRRSSKLNVTKLIRLYKILRNYDIIHVHSRHVLRYVGLILFLPRSLRSFKVIYQDHSLIPLTKVFKEQFYIHKLIKRIDALIVVTNAQRQFFPGGSQVFLLENIVRKPEFHWDLKSNVYKLVAVGNFRRIKNYSFLLDILQRLPSEYSCDIFTNTIDAVYFSENKDRIEDLQNQGKLKIIQGETEIQKRLINYSMAIHTSLSESGPLIAVESLSVGLPIIMYDTGAVVKHIKKICPELVKENTSCESWVDAIIQYHNDVKKMGVYSDALYQLYLKKYSEDKYYEKCQQIYHQTLNY